MTTMIALGVALGAVTGAGVGYIRFRRAVIGAILGACCGGVVFYFFGRRPEPVIAVETPDEFRSRVLKSDKPVLVDFYADWCGPCRRLAPTIESLAEEFAGRVKFVKINVDKGPELAHHYQVRGIPAVILFVDGRPVERWTGAHPAEEYRRAIEQVLSNR